MMVLPDLLQQLNRQQQIQLEIIIADGGSTDDTLRLELAENTQLIHTKKGRGHQMNQAASQAQFDLLLFIHADSKIQSNTLLYDATELFIQILDQLSSQQLAGHFKLKFDRQDEKNQTAYSYYESKTALNRAECTNGDQGLLITKTFFNQLGGFDEQLHFLEDQRLAEKIRKQGTWITLPGTLITSARRFEEEGFVRRMILSAFIMNYNYIGYQDFFTHAPGVYKQQDVTQSLDIYAYFNLVHQLNKKTPLLKLAKRWIATGNYTKIHCWQLFFFWDVKLNYFKAELNSSSARTKLIPLLDKAELSGSVRFNDNLSTTVDKKSKTPFLNFYDKIFSHIINFYLFDLVCTALVYGWFHLSRIRYWFSKHF